MPASRFPAPAAPPRPAPVDWHPTAVTVECEVRQAPARPLHLAVALGGTDLGRSGIGTCVREVLPRLIPQVTATGGKVTVFGHRRELAAYAPALEGATTATSPFLFLQPGLNAWWHLERAGAFARRAGADVLLLPAANRRIARAAGLPTVAIVHDLAQLRVQRKYGPLRMLYFRRILLPAFRRPARLVAVSGTTRDDLISTLHVPAERVRVVYNGVNAHRFRAATQDRAAVAAVRQRTGLATRPYLLYPSRLEHPGKNHVRLLHAFALSGLAATHTLALTGADWGAGDLLARTVRELRLEPSVRFLGFQPAEDIPALVAGAAAVLMLGLHEGFGLPALEALSAGRPVCVSNTGALPEVVGPFGIQCDPLRESSIAEALRRITSDAAVRERCEQDGPAWAARFSWDRTAEGILEACHDAAVVVNRE